MDNPTIPTPNNEQGGNHSRYVSIVQFTRDATVAITNAQLPDIAPALEKSGYSGAEIAAKKQDIDNLNNLNENQKKEYGEASAATDNYNKAENLLHSDYIAHLNLGRIALKNNVAAQIGLGLQGKRKAEEAGYCRQALLFYNGVLADPTYQAALLKKGVPDKELVAMRDGYTKLDELAAAKAKEGGEAQQATKTRNLLYDELKEWYSEFKETAIIALRKQPQAIEKLGWKES